jgi:Carboxypeptidase regulatory-like domain
MIYALFATATLWVSPANSFSVIQTATTIQGRVVDETSGRGLGGAVVYAISDVGVERVTANGRGGFIFLALLPGDYVICASKAGYPLDCAPHDDNTIDAEAGVQYRVKLLLSPSTRP